MIRHAIVTLALCWSMPNVLAEERVPLGKFVGLMEYYEEGASIKEKPNLMKLDIVSGAYASDKGGDYLDMRTAGTAKGKVYAKWAPSKKHYISSGDSENHSYKFVRKHGFMFLECVEMKGREPVGEFRILLRKAEGDAKPARGSE